MTIKDTIKSVLAVYGFDNISIEVDKHSLYEITYIVEASSTRNPDHIIYAIGEGLMDTLYNIFTQINEMNIHPSTDFIGCSAKDVINDLTRKRIIEVKLEQEKKVKELSDSQKWIVDLAEKYNPCKGCKLNNHQHWDNIHYNCEKNHTMSCIYLTKFMDIYSSLLKYNRDKEKNKYNIESLINDMKDNKSKTI